MPSRKSKKKSSKEASSLSSILERMKNKPRPETSEESSGDEIPDLDDDEENVGIHNLNNVVAIPTSSHSNLLQFLHKQNAEVQKELSEGKCMIWNFKLDINI